MGILGITNRTENWKTAEFFAPFFEYDSARTRLAKRLLEPLGKSHEVQPCTVKIELFWYGMRDYVDLQRKQREPEPTPETLAESYLPLFSDPNKLDLCRQINEIDKHDTLTDRNYNVSNRDWKEKLWTNLNNTEIDVIVKTPNHLFIGEAKHETTAFDADKNRFLMHQLIREYVMASTLIDCLESDKEVVPFVVGNEPDKIKEPHPNLKHIHQIGFLRDVGWLKEENVLSWDCIDEIAKSTPTAN
ncbi:MAG: hypothetical protein OXD46_05040 [Chloroflexi bacterium]|nr:hypothetical protein [Chloroflexota bacterium]